MRTRQLTFADVKKSSKTADFTRRTIHGGTSELTAKFGGSDAHPQRKKRKLFRPLDPRKPLHLVFKSSRAKGDWSFRRFKHIEHIKKLTYSLAKQNQVRVIEYANAGNHLHLLVHAKNRDGFKKFTRTLTGLVARLVTGARKGSPIRGRFWDSLFFSRVVEWGKAYFTARGYVIKNELEAEGIIPYSPRKRRTLRP
jgi:REP element-mobilizing transposase RayT